VFFSRNSNQDYFERTFFWKELSNLPKAALPNAFASSGSDFSKLQLSSFCCWGAKKKTNFSPLAQSSSLRHWYNAQK